MQIGIPGPGCTRFTERRAGEGQGTRLDLDLGKPFTPLKSKFEFVQADTGLFIKAGLNDAVVRADRCCVFECALAVDVDSSTQTLPTKGSSREYSDRKLGEVSSVGA